MSSSTASRLKEIMRIRNLRQTDILHLAQPYCEKYRIKLGKSDLSQVVNGKNIPGQWKLTILGLALDVSESWLMGLDVPMEREKTPISTKEDGRKAEFNDLFQELTADQQDLIIAQIKGILSQR